MSSVMLPEPPKSHSRPSTDRVSVDFDEDDLSVSFMLSSLTQRSGTEKCYRFILMLLIRMIIDNGCNFLLVKPEASWHD